MLKQTVTYTTCPECESKNLVMDMERGELVCENCGLVIEENILHQGAEWTAFTQQERNSKERVGVPTRYSHFDKGLSTTIRVDRDAFGRPLSPKVKREMWRLRRWQIRSKVHASQDRNLMMAMGELRRLSEKLHIPSSVQEMAAVIYRKALDRGMVKGRSIPAIVAGSLYAACRFTKTPRTLKELAETSLREEKEISRAYRLIVEDLQMEMPIDDPMDYATKIAEKAGVSSDVEGLAIKIIRDAKNNHATMGKDPSGLAAAALYIASRLKKEKITQKRLAKAAGSTEVTVRNRTKGLMKRLDLNIRPRGVERS
ncbi:MAG: transcription initiation factor IIB [Candidatus Bathyarchaeota archaeon]|nr:transcription initiation factor IIB [Candidatus Bathyarchaeota archaeon]